MILFHRASLSASWIVSDFSRKREKSQRFLSDKFDFFSGFAVEYGRRNEKEETRRMEFSIHICEYNRSNADYETIYRPEGSGDYLFLLFKTPMKVYDGTAFFIAQENACLFYTPDHEQHYQAVQKFRNSYVHFWCGENLGETYGIPQNTVFYPQNTEAIDELIRLLQREYIVKDPYAVEYEEALVRQMMIMASRGMRLYQAERRRSRPDCTRNFRSCALRC